MSNALNGLRRFSTIARFCIALAMTAAAAHAQTFSISNLPTSATTGSASYPTMVTDAKGNVNVAWIDSAKGIMFARSTDGKTFPTQVAVQVQPPAGAPLLPAFQPQMAVYQNDTTVIEIVWAAPDPTSTPAAPTYDVFAARSSNAGLNFVTTLNIATVGGVPLADTPRLAFDFSGKVNVVWGKTGAWISQSQDGLNFSAVINLAPAVVPPNPPLNTGGPRIAVDAANDIFVAWTDESNKNATGSYCTSIEPPAGTPVPNTIGGNIYVNETLANTAISATKTRNLSNTDWANVNTRFPHGFFGCSYDNLTFFTNKSGLVRLLWSDDSPIEDVLTSKVGNATNADGTAIFSFPINLATLPAAAPREVTDANGSYYVVWSGGPTGGGFNPGATNSQGVFFSRSDDDGSTFSAGVNVAPPTAFAPAYPQVTVDSKGNVSVAWEQAHKAIAADGSDTFDVFLASSPDKGATFSTLSQVSTNASLLCIAAGNPPTTPDTTTCGTVQLGLDVNSSPVMAWVNHATTGAAAANIDFAAKSGSDFTVTLPAPSQNALAGQTASFTVNSAAIGTFAGSITLSCSNFSAANLTCSFTPAGGTINAGQSSTVNVALPAGMAAGAVTFTVHGTSGGTTHGVTATINVGTPPTPGFSVTLAASSASALAGGAATFNVQITPTNGFNQAVTLSCSGLPSGATCSFTPATTTSASTLTVSTPSSAAVGSSQFTVTGTSGSTKDSKPATLVIGTITASASASSATIAAQSSANFTLNLSSANGFNGTVTLDCPGLPTGITCTFNPASMSVPGSTTLTVSVGAKPTGSLIHNGPQNLDGLFGLQRNTALSMAFVALALILSGMIAASRRQKPLPLARGLAVMALVMVLAVGLISCGGSTSNSTTSTGGGTGSATPFTGQITVRAQSGGAATNLSTLSITVP